MGRAARHLDCAKTNAAQKSACNKYVYYDCGVIGCRNRDTEW